MRENPSKWPAVGNMARVIPESAGRTALPQTTDHIQRVVAQIQVLALEKLDGSNFGKTDTGVVVSRNTVVTDSTFQKTSLDALPSLETVRALKQSIEDCIGCDLPPLTVYGELLCLSAYTYTKRGLPIWSAFGVVLDTSAMCVLAVDILELALNKHEFWTHDSTSRGALVLVASEALLRVFARVDIVSAPVVARGSFVDVCACVHPMLMHNELTEGVVVTGPHCIYKWKNAFRCNGNYAKFYDATDIFPSHELQTVLAILHSVVMVAPDRFARPRGVEGVKVDPYAPAQLAEALASAETKFDAIEMWLATNDSAKEFAGILRAELFSDLEVTSKAQKMCIGSVVAARLNAARIAMK